MSNNLLSWKQRRAELETSCDTMLRAAESGTKLVDSDRARLKLFTREIGELSAKIESVERSPNNSIVNNFNPAALMGAGQPGPRTDFRAPHRSLSAEYASSFYTMIRSGGKGPADPALAEGFDSAGGGFVLPGFAPRTNIGATLYEGTNSAGGYAVPISVDDQIVPLAPQEMSVRQLATVIPTAHDIKFPVKGSFGTATAKAETSAFTESDPTLTQFTLSAFMAGIQETISWELAQDVPAFQAFAVDDMILAQQMYEENLYINGTGSGQAQGIIGNVGTGFGPQEPDSNGNLVSIAGLLNLVGTLNSVYHPGASFLMQRATSIIIRKAQMESNLFYPAFTRDADGTDRLFGYPVKYATDMPAATRGNIPVVFGDFKRGYLIGDRGGSGINVKVLDQVQAQNGLLVLLAYRRTDGRVRRSEALQAYSVSAS
jgi:HK97 family phage major capsid protein